MKSVFVLLGVAIALVLSSPAQAVIMYGALSNFDAINDTGVTARGFEIELEGCTTSDVSYTFGAPYNRYGDPVITTGPTGSVIVRYASSYNSATQLWAAGTDTGTLADTGGHSLFNGSYPGYPGTVPGDHFGIGLNVNPTNTVYRWLVEDSQSPGTLTPFGTNVRIPAPVITLVQPANPALPHVVQAAVPAPPNDNDPAHPLFGEAIWVKVFITEVQAPEPVDLDHLVLGDPAVPPETETEIEWQLLQAGKMDFDERGDAVDLGDANESVTRRYDFYQYLGGYDVEGEAINENPFPFDADQNPSGYDPLAFPDGVVGNFIGRQNVAANFAVPEPATVSLLGLGLAGLIARRKRS
jgi:hypothetical protein